MRHIKVEYLDIELQTLRESAVKLPFHQLVVGGEQKVEELKGEDREDLMDYHQLLQGKRA